MALGAAITVAAIGAAGTAYAADRNASAAEKANKAASKPSTYQPWDQLMPYLSDALGQNRSVYDQVMQNYSKATGLPYSGAGGTSYNLASFEKAIAADPRMPAAGKEWILSFARRGEWDTVAQNLPKMQLSDQTRASLGTLAGGSAPAARTGTGGGGGGGGRSGGSGGGGGANLIPDTMAQGSFFGDQARSFFDPSALDPANDPTLQPYIDALRRNFQEQLDQQLLGIDEASNARGMYAGSGRALQASLTSQKGNQALADALAQVYMGQRQDALGRQMDALGMINERDLGAGQMATQRAVANTAASVQRAGIAAQNRQFNATLARQDAVAPLDIFNSYLGGLGQISNMGPSTRTGPYNYTNPGPGAFGAGMTALGGGLMAGYGMGAFGAPQQQTTVRPS